MPPALASRSSCNQPSTSHHITRCSHGLGNGVFGISALDAATALRLGAEEVRTQVMVQYLSETPCVERADGRRPKVLPPEIAQLVILDLEAGHSRSAIVRRYERVAPFSRDWLTSRIVDRGLWEMAGWGDRVFDRGEAAATEDSEHDVSGVAGGCLSEFAARSR